MGTSWFLARRELVRHRVRWALIGLGVVIVSTVVIATAAGARRTSSVYDRFRAHNRVASTAVLTQGLSADQFAEVSALPQIASSSLVFRYPGRLSVEGQPGGEELVLIGGPRVGEDVNRFTFVSGRAPEAADEIALDSLAAEQTGLGPGDRVEFAPYDTTDPLNGDAQDGTQPPTLAPEQLRVTGVVATADSLARLPGGTLNGFTSPEYHDSTGRGAAFQALEVRLVDTPNAFDEFQAALAAMRQEDPTLPEGLAPIGNSGDTESRVQTALDALAVTLLIIAVAVFLAGIVLLQTVLSRLWDQKAEDSQRLAAMGATRGQRIAGLAAPPLVVAIPAVALGVLGAWVVSDWFPVSAARALETSRGRSIDWVAIGGGVLLVSVAVIAVAFLSAWRSTRRASRSRAAAARVSRSRVAWLPLGSVPGTGARFAFDRTSGRSPIRTVSAGLITGVAGVVAVIIVSGTIHGVGASPPRFGWNWDIAVKGELTNNDLDRYGVSDDVAAAAVVRGSIVELPIGAAWSFRMEPFKGSMEFTMLRGRLPIGPGELAAGPVWLRDHHLEVGDIIGAANGAPAMTVVGEALVPAFDDDAIGGTVVVHGVTPSVLAPPVVRTALTLEPGVSRSEVLAKLQRALPAGSVDSRSVPLVPVELRNLTRTTGMQRILAVLLALTAVAALAHLLTSAIRERRREIAIMRTLGYTPRQAGFALVWTGVSAAVVGFVIGVPIGIALGLLVWRIVATSIGIASNAIVSSGAIGLLLVATLLAAVLISWLPARRAAQLQPGAILRGE